MRDVYRAAGCGNKSGKTEKGTTALNTDFVSNLKAR